MRSIYGILLTVITFSIIFPIDVHPYTPKSSYMETKMWKNYVTPQANSKIQEYTANLNDEKELVPDPIYHLNKIMFTLNDKIYFLILKPFIKCYKSIIPSPVRTSIKNFFHNISMPARFANCLMQGKWDAAQGEMARFIINSTFGVGGLLNHTSKYPELNPPVEDMGQTLGSYKIGNGFYIVWPILGPSTLRDSIGMIGDWFLNPLHHLGEDTADRMTISSIEIINDTSFNIGQYEIIKDAAFDPYEAFRDAYIQSRNSKIKQ